MTDAHPDRAARTAELRADAQFAAWMAEPPPRGAVLLRQGIRAAAGTALCGLGSWFALSSPALGAGESPWTIVRLLPIVNAVAGGLLALWALWRIAAFLAGPRAVFVAIVAEPPGRSSGETIAPREDDPVGTVAVVLEDETGVRRELETPCAVAARLVAGDVGVAQTQSGWLLRFRRATSASRTAAR